MGFSHQKLGGIGTLSPRFHLTARAHVAQNVGENLFQSSFIQGAHDEIGFSAHHLSGFEEAAMRILPTALVQQPLLDHHRRQLGINLRQDAPRFFTARVLKVTMLFPQTEKSLDLPAQTQQDEHLVETDQASGQIGDHDGPVGQVQHLFGWLVTMILRALPDVLASLIPHLTRHALDADANGQALLPQDRPKLDALSYLLGQDAPQHDLRSVAPTQLGSRLPSRKKVAASLASLAWTCKLAEAGHAAEAQIRNHQAALGQLLHAQRTAFVAVTAIGDEGTLQFPIQDIPASKELKTSTAGSRAPSASPPDLGQLLR